MSQSETELFPRVDAAQFRILVRLPSGTRLEETEKTLARIEQTLMLELGEPDPEYPKVEAHPDSDLRMLISNIGVLMDWLAAYTPNTGPMDAFILVQLEEDRRNVFQFVKKLRHSFQRQFPKAELAFDCEGHATFQSLRTIAASLCPCERWLQSPLAQGLRSLAIGTSRASLTSMPMSIRIRILERTRVSSARRGVCQ